MVVVVVVVVVVEAVTVTADLKGYILTQQNTVLLRIPGYL
jgi:hypothetical protein